MFTFSCWLVERNWSELIASEGKLVLRSSVSEETAASMGTFLGHHWSCEMVAGTSNHYCLHLNLETHWLIDYSITGIQLVIKHCGKWAYLLRARLDDWYPSHISSLHLQQVSLSYLSIETRHRGGEASLALTAYQHLYSSPINMSYLASYWIRIFHTTLNCNKQRDETQICVKHNQIWKMEPNTL